MPTCQTCPASAHPRLLGRRPAVAGGAQTAGAASAPAGQGTHHLHSRQVGPHRMCWCGECSRASSWRLRREVPKSVRQNLSARSPSMARSHVLMQWVTQGQPLAPDPAGRLATQVTTVLCAREAFGFCNTLDPASAYWLLQGCRAPVTSVGAVGESKPARSAPGQFQSLVAHHACQKWSPAHLGERCLMCHCPAHGHS